jgi:septum site-determining protein MinD
VLEILSVPLLGIVPESEAVLRASNLGMPVTLCATDSAARRAYTDAARRLSGADIKVTIPADKKGFFNKLFVRRAA